MSFTAISLPLGTLTITLHGVNQILLEGIKRPTSAHLKIVHIGSTKTIKQEYTTASARIDINTAAMAFNPEAAKYLFHFPQLVEGTLHFELYSSNLLVGVSDSYRMVDLSKPNFDARIPSFPLRLPSNMNIVNGSLDFRVQYSINQERITGIQNERNRLTNLPSGLLNFQIVEGTARAIVAKNVCEYVNMFNDLIELVQLVGHDTATTIYFKRRDANVQSLQHSLTSSTVNAPTSPSGPMMPERSEQQVEKAQMQ